MKLIAHKRTQRLSYYLISEIIIIYSNVKIQKGRKLQVVSELIIRHLTMESYWPVDRARDQRPLLGRLLLVPNQQIIQVNNKSKQDEVFKAP